MIEGAAKATDGAKASRMKVLQIHGRDIPQGFGGAVSTYRLHLGLRASGIDSRILCHKRGLDSSIEIPRSPRLERLISQVSLRLGLNDVHCVGAFKIKKIPAYREADLLNFHGIHGQFFSYLALPFLTKSKPAVFTVRDMWPLTGHCAVSYDCERWKTGCGSCPYPSAPPALPTKRDSTHMEWKLKSWAYRQSRLAVVTLSRRMTEQARQSMLGHFPIHHIPNGVNTEVYRPLDPSLCRSALGIPAGKKVLMFGAGYLNRQHKGSDLLAKALHALPSSIKAEIVLLLLGEGGEVIAHTFDVPVIPLGFVGGHRIKALAYSAADLFVLPTRGEGLPNVLLESMACGTPMVSFDVGGVPDLVRPGVTGYLARPEDAQDLECGIRQLLEDAPLRRKMSRQCRNIACAEYSVELEVQKYVALYRSMVGNGHHV
jgi:glycosyltransferase involved in cell wall biosynthesis